MNQRPLHLQFVLTSLPIGGAEMLLLNLIKAMDRINFCPEIVCLKEAGELGPEFAKHVPVHSHLIGNKYDVSVLFRLKRLFQKRSADAVITVGAGDKMFWGRLAASLARIPVVCSALHSTGWPDGVGKLNRLLTPITDGFIAVAKSHADYLVQSEGFPVERVFTIPNGVDTQRFVLDSSMRGWLRRTLNLPEHSRLVGIVAALREEKNHSQFINAACQVQKLLPETHFVIVGDGPERQKIETEIADSGIQSHFHLLGSRQDTPRILAGLDVFCLTSKNEANPVSILEAFSCGVPVVSSNVGSICETVLPETTGLLTKPLNASETASALCRLLENPGLASQLGRNGRNRVVANCSLQSMVQGYQSLIQRLYNMKAKYKGSEAWIPSPVGHAKHNDPGLSEGRFAEPVSSTLTTPLTGASLPYVEGSRSTN